MLKYWNLFDKPVVNNSSQGKVENINAFKSLPYHLVSFPVRVGVCAVMGFVHLLPLRLRMSSYLLYPDVTFTLIAHPT